MQNDVFMNQLRATVERHATRPAVVEQGRVAYTYLQLWRAATCIAARLQAHSVQRESVVGVHLPRSADLVAAIAGVWRAGAAYVPLVPSLPDSRFEYILADAAVQVVITDSRGLLKWRGRLPALTVEETGQDHTMRFDPPDYQRGDLAYVIYTSGTTGQPKGVAIEQRGLLKLFRAQVEAFQLQPGSRSLFIVSPSFDASVSDLGTALLSGATLYIQPQDSAHDSGMDPVKIARNIRQFGITHMDIPPAMLALIEPSEPLPSLQTIVIGGEACRADVVRAWARRCRVVNVYGPTEATVCTSLCVCDSDQWRRPLIGQPIAGVAYRIEPIDGTNDSGPTVKGELLISGGCLARGYLNQPELTKRQFPILDGRRWYRTGDVIRRDPDGEFVFVGRVDRQLKLHGVRIEPEEIESVISRVDGVQRCAVVARRLTENSNHHTLVAFVAPAKGAELRADGVRTSLAQSLPHWMLPGRIEIVDRIPETSSGKVDTVRLATLSLWTGSPPAAAPAQSKTTDEEEHLLAIWRDVLKVPCGPGDDFFELGGDSLTALEVIAAARSRGLAISPSQLVARPTVRDLCTLLSHATVNEGLQMRRADELRGDACADAVELRELAAAQRRGPETKTNPAGRILLTGATGFLGSRVLEQLLQQSERRIVCLVRAAEQQTARRRVTEALRLGRLPSQSLARVDTVVADLSEQRCGLNQETWHQLAETTHTIFHCAARVNLLEPYEELRRTNLQGLAELLRLCVSGRRKQFNYASSLSVFVGTDHCQGTLLESDELSSTEVIFGGYAQSKWAAETLLRAVQLPPSRCRLFRFGLLAIDTRTGALPQRDLLPLAIAGLVATGCVLTKVPDVRIDVTPVDFAARAMVRLGLSDPTEMPPQTYHVANPPGVSLGRLMRCLKHLRPELREVTPDHFLELVGKQTPDTQQAAACLGLCRVLAPADFKHYRPLDLFQATGAQFDMTNTNRGLHGSGIECPLANDPLVTSWLQRILDHDAA